LNRNPLDLVERNLILAAVVELRCPRALVVGDVLRGFKRALVLPVRGDALARKVLVPDPRLDAGAARPPVDNAIRRPAGRLPQAQEPPTYFRSAKSFWALGRAA